MPLPSPPPQTQFLGKIRQEIHTNATLDRELHALMAQICLFMVSLTL